MVDDRVRAESFAVPPGQLVDIDNCPTTWEGPPPYADLSEKKLKKAAKGFLKDQTDELADLQEALYANNSYSVLLVFQGRDAAGKDSTIKHVMSGINPQGCQVVSFKKPSSTELDHNYLWRCWKALPERGRIGIFNRSYYEEVLVVRVHEGILRGQSLPPELVTEDIWAERYEDINAFERHMVRNGTVIIKFWLNVSWEEQRARFLDRIDTREKNWKFSSSDLSERGHWKDYSAAVNPMLQETSTSWAPWYVIPADNKWVMRALVSHVVTERLERLKLPRPRLSDEETARLGDARTALLEEPEKLT